MVGDFTKPDAQVTERMRRVRSRGTGLEARMESIFQELGVGYEVQPKLRGHPDFRIDGTRILVYCDSSFWHGRSEADVSGRSFRRNRKSWASKIAATKARDVRISRSLRNAGWRVLRFWDDDIFQNPAVVERRLKGALKDEGT